MKALGLKRTMPLEFLRSEPIWRSYGPKTICPYMGIGTENGLLRATKWARSKIFNSNLHYIINRHEIHHIVEFQPQSCPNNDFRAKNLNKWTKSPISQIRVFAITISLKSLRLLGFEIFRYTIIFYGLPSAH